MLASRGARLDKCANGDLAAFTSAKIVRQCAVSKFFHARGVDENLVTEPSAVHVGATNESDRRCIGAVRADLLAVTCWVSEHDGVAVPLVDGRGERSLRDELRVLGVHCVDDTFHQRNGWDHEMLAAVPHFDGGRAERATQMEVA